MRDRGASLTLVAVAAVATIALTVALPAGAQAAATFCPQGSGAGQCLDPEGVAADTETGQLFTVDRANNRVSVFEASGQFVRAFGWGVANGTTAALQVCTTSCFKGIAGFGAGQFNKPGAIAVDNDPTSASHHDLYVGTDNFRVQKFEPDGTFVGSLGSKGKGSCQFERENDRIAVGPGGTVYVADTYSEGENRVGRIVRFSDTGTCEGDLVLFSDEKGTMQDMAVDSAGNIYVTVEGVEVQGGGQTQIRKYDAAGTFVAEIDVGTPSGIQNNALAIGPEDHLFAGQDEERFQDRFRAIGEYAPDGTQLRRWGYGTLIGQVLGVAITGGGEVFLSERSTGLRLLPIPTDNAPIFNKPAVTADPIGNTKVTLSAKINPEGLATTVHFELIRQSDFESEGWAGAQSTPEEPVGSDVYLHLSSGKGTVVPETIYRMRAIATNADGETTSEEQTFKSLPPLEISATWPSEVSPEGAILNASVNPLGIPSVAYFEYVTEAEFQQGGFAGASRAPTGEATIELGAGESPVTASAPITGLLPATTYRFRVIAADPFFPAGVPGPAAALRTPGAPAGVPDGRRYELVSSVEKMGAEVGLPSSVAGAASGLYDNFSQKIESSSGDGEAMTFTSFTSFGDAEGAAGTSQYLSRRSAAGWQTKNISPFGFPIDPLRIPYRGFTPDLDFGGFVMGEPALTSEAPEGFEGLYLRDSRDGSLQALLTEAPEVTPGVRFCTRFEGASNDGRHAIFAANGSLAGAPKGAGFSLYEWSAGGGLQFAGALPGGGKALPLDKNHFGAASQEGCAMGGARVAGAISGDGRRVFWTYALGQGRLIARIDGGKEVIQLDAVQGGAGPSGGGRYLWASPDGSKVLFGDESPLTPGANEGAGEDLYLYDFDAPAGTRLTDLTAAAPAHLLGLVGAAGDGSSAYFTATGVLSGEEAGPVGGSAQAGKPNLYRWSATEGVRFIATLEGAGTEDAWASVPSRHDAAVSPDGMHLAFLTSASLTGYDNTVESGGCQADADGSLSGSPACPQAYLYDAAGPGSLSCVSCNPTLARPTGPASLPGWANPYQGPRYLSAEGSRLFFESFDALLPADTNRERDVYEFERPGKGSCTPASASFTSSAGGCLYLVSDGKSTDHSYLLDASADGRDVFFATRSQLLSTDPDPNYDVYDYRVDGFPPPAPDQPPCASGQACRPPAAAAPQLPSAPTSAFQGPGNLKPNPEARCTRAARLAKRLLLRAKRLRRAAHRAHAPRAHRLRRAAARRAKRARKLTENARRCRVGASKRRSHRDLEKD